MKGSNLVEMEIFDFIEDMISDMIKDYKVKKSNGEMSCEKADGAIEALEEILYQLNQE